MINDWKVFSRLLTNTLVAVLYRLGPPTTPITRK